jgi:ribosomal protein S18 acetylase RimI-like enzyme
MTKGHIKIRRAIPADSEGCAALLGELGYPATSAFVHEKLKQLANGEGDRVLVAVDGGIIVGLASCHIMPLMHRSENLCRVTSLVVGAGHRRRNIGRRLMREIEEYAQDSGCSRVEITSGAHRQVAHGFYGQIGYKEVSRRFVKQLGNGED